MDDPIVLPFARFQELYAATCSPMAEPGTAASAITETIRALKARFPCLTTAARAGGDFHRDRREIDRRDDRRETGEAREGREGRDRQGAREAVGGGRRNTHDTERQWGRQSDHGRQADHGGHHGRRSGRRGFRDGRDGRNESHGHGGGHRSHAERPRIGTRELNREDISKKDFVANMNKLSRQNYDAILRLIRTTYNSNFLQNYMDILWSMMIRQPDFQDLHIQVVQHLFTITPPERKSFVQTYWSQRCHAYFQEKQWTPPEDFFSASAATAEYDEFCDYLKWKKTTGASLLAWLRLMEHEVIPADVPMCFGAILNDIHDAFRDQTHKFAECLLEWFVQMVSATVEICPQVLPPDMDVVLNDWLQIIKERGLSSSLRFKIMDVRDMLYKK